MYCVAFLYTRGLRSQIKDKLYIIQLIVLEALRQLKLLSLYANSIKLGDVKITKYQLKEQHLSGFIQL